MKTVSCDVLFETYKFKPNTNVPASTGGAQRTKHQRIKKYGERSKIRTAIGEEPIKLAQYLRGEKEDYLPIKIRIR
ncbi:MAG: hypothetical protein MUO36_04390 [Candidatus Hadarchaeum sp.]|nr:hypothetical protein [Candidatus Hadarchaeum sp.]